MYAILSHGMIYGLYRNVKAAQNKADKMNYEIGYPKYVVQQLNKRHACLS